MINLTNLLVSESSAAPSATNDLNSYDRWAEYKFIAEIDQKLKKRGKISA
jgi:hypothetical protein